MRNYSYQLPNRLAVIHSIVLIMHTGDEKKYQVRKPQRTLELAGCTQVT